MTNTARPKHTYLLVKQGNEVVSVKLLDLLNNPDVKEKIKLFAKKPKFREEIKGSDDDANCMIWRMRDKDKGAYAAKFINCLEDLNID